MNLKTLVMSSAALGLLAAPMPCGQVKPPSSLGDAIGDSSQAADAAGKLSKANAAKEKGYKSCDVAAARDVPIDEEYSIGGVVALNWAVRGGGVMIEPDPDIKLTPADKATQPKDVKLNLEGPKTRVNAYLNQVGKNLAAQSSRPGLPWSFAVLEDPKSINAISAPGGFVLVTRGLLKLVKNEAQLAGVLSHEIAHITEKHGLKLYQEETKAACRKPFTMEFIKSAGQAADSMPDLVQVDIPAPPLPAGVAPFAADAAKVAGTFKKLAGLGKGAFNLDSPDNWDAAGVLGEGVVGRQAAGLDGSDERIADTRALQLMIEVGYDPYEYISFIKQIPEAGMFAKHPKNSEREAAMKEVLNNLYKNAEFGPKLEDLKKLAKPSNKDELAAVK